MRSLRADPEFWISSLLVKSDGISRAPGPGQEAGAPAAQLVDAAGGPEVEPDGVSRWLWARFDAGSDAVVTGLVAGSLQLGVGWIVHAVCLVLAAGAAVIMCLLKTRLVIPNGLIPSLLVISDGI
jgi:hypothetical protein